ncbi:MAG: hypothetical protein HXY26_02135 [Hydrogenophilaceae bacterium]|nr:hypothetical protein [Hydrogenophilaceae bacterium]
MIAGFSDADLSLVQAALRERFGRQVAVEGVETEIRLHPVDRELTACPALYWKEDDCNFVVSKTGENQFRSMFFWSIKDRFSTGKEEYDNLGDCVVTTLKMQEEASRLREAETTGR